MQDDSLKASVQYGDYTGSAAADGHDRRGISDLAQKYGIDTERFFVFGVEFHIGETRDDALARTYVSILATDTRVVNAFGVGPIQRWVDEHDGVLPYLRIDIDATLEEVLLSFKRLDVVINNSQITRVREYRRTLE